MIPHIAIYLALITPTIIDNVPVYPTNHVVIAQAPTQDYRWDTVTIPDSWPLDTYYVELWDAYNQPIAGHYATKLTSHTIDISDIDASLTPSIRAVIFQPPNTPPPPFDYAVYISYQSYTNYRLFALLIVATLIYGTIIIWSFAQKNQLRHLPSAISQLVHGQNISSLHASIITILFAGLFGVVLGTFVGGIQILYLFIKLPFLMGSALLISFTTLATLSLLLGIKKSITELWQIALNLLAVTAIGLASFSLLLGFYIIYPLNHDQVLIATVAFFIAAGLLALTILYRWIKNPFIPLLWLIIYGLVFLQLGWLLRPWVGVIDPVHGSVPIARANSGNVFNELINLIN